MLEIKKNLLVGTVVVGSLFPNNSIGIEKERRNGETEPIVRIFVGNSKQESVHKREEKKPKMEKVPVLSEPETIKSTVALRRLLWQAKGLSNRSKQLIKLGELTLDIPKEYRKEAAAQCANSDHISTLEIPSYLIVRNFIREPNKLKTTVRRDLEKDSIADIHRWLNHIAKLSKSRGADTAYNVLSIHNATQEQADEILNASTITHLGGIRIWLRPTPVEAELSIPNKEDNKETPQTIEQHSVKGESEVSPALDFLSQAPELSDEEPMIATIEVSHPDLVPIEPLLEPRNEGEKEGATKITEKDGMERFARDLHQGRFKPTLREIANRKGAFHRRLLSQPHLFDLSVVSVHMVLDLLRKAHKYSQEDSPIQVPLSLHNITKRQLDDILTDENADYIKSLKWEYREGEENIQDENVDVLDEPLHQQLDGQLLKKGDVPVLEELAQNLEEQALFEPEEEQNKEVSQGYEGEPILLNWEMTSLTKGIDLDDLGFESDREAKKQQDPVLPQAQHASQNLVQLYCRPYLRR